MVSFEKEFEKMDTEFRNFFSGKSNVKRISNKKIKEMIDDVDKTFKDMGILK